MADDEGASPRELVVEACRRDQQHLIEQVLDGMAEKTNEEVAEFFNSVKDALGNYALHICATYGSYDVMDALFDIQYFECDPVTRVDQDTPLHVAVRYANEQDSELGREMISMMCEAGCDPRVRNKHGQKPVDLVYGDHTEIKSVLQKAEYVLNENIHADEDADEGAGSASDSE
ncbi:ankyrin repeat protein [Talaromyces proteolyticus]|uniref:Ankyrin repeat protein n=1 Tax=Talaromyces proteolyticus TaxID=1131652 RepID=A0AAD4KPP0_9EURO|nr:ankyrin repeat protein [Talaromyces proteolyticus]KAH8692754.1 ankyrin repeat protein [Talaromyces proteolyticus]